MSASGLHKGVLDEHPVAKCCWCRRSFVRVGEVWWCPTARCADAQRAYGIAVQRGTAFEWLYVPLPIQVEAERQKRTGANDGRGMNVMSGGAAGTAKSMGARWSMYRRALSLPGYTGLLLRESFPQLERTHLLKMVGDEARMTKASVECEFKPTARRMVFGNGSLIECGHLGDGSDLENYLSAEYDDIVPDEASRFPPSALFQLAARARTSKRAVLEAGGPWFRPMTNPGGPSAAKLRDYFIDHTPDLALVAEAGSAYEADLWRFVPSTLEDNPYLAAGYGAQLAVSHADDPVRYQQLRWADWRVTAGQFFTTWHETKDGAPWHVRELPGSAKDFEWVRSLDWGRTQPGSVGWWLLLPDGRVHRRREWKFVDMDVPDVCAEILRRERDDFELDLGRYRYSVCDKALFAKTQDRGIPIAEQFRQGGIHFRPSNSERIHGWERLRTWLRADREGPRMTVDPSCLYLRRTLPMAQSDPSDPEDLDTRGDDHALDEVRYFVMSRPSPTGGELIPEYPVDSAGFMAQGIRDAIRTGVS